MISAPGAIGRIQSGNSPSGPTTKHAVAIATRRQRLGIMALISLGIAIVSRISGARRRSFSRCSSPLRRRRNPPASARSTSRRRKRRPRTRRRRHRRRAWHGPGARAFASQPQRDRTGFDSLRQGHSRHFSADCGLQQIAEVHAELQVLQPERRARRHQEQLARLRRRAVQHHFRRRAVRRRQRSDASFERLFSRRVPVQRSRRSRPRTARAKPATRPSAARCRSIPALCPTSSAGR